MRLFAFRGVRYAGSDPGRLAAPPYDQINDEDRDRFHASDPHHFVHLTRPVSPAGLEGAEHAATLHRSWLEEGAIRTDSRPALYPYEIRLARGGRRLGVFALVGLEEPSAGVIRPHELTIDKTVEERLELVRRTRADFGPVLLLSDDRGLLEALLEEDIDGGDPVARHHDAGGEEHLLFRVEAPDRIARYQEILASSSGLIADGHHRYKTSRLYASEVGAAPGTAAAAKLCVVTSLASSGLSIDPIHRVLPAPINRWLDSGVLTREPVSAKTGTELAATVAGADQPALGVRTAEGAELWRLDPGAGPTDLPAAASQLSVVLLHRTLLPQWGYSPSATTDGTVLYRSDPDDPWKMVDDGSAAVGLWLPPMSPEGFSAAIADGDVLPPKSTRFLPKVVSGLVWSDLEAPLD